jgi:CRISPR-associated endonuclease/helicase Cas3
MELFSHPNKLLEVHLSNVGNNIKKLIEEKDIKPSLFSKDNLIEIGYSVGVLHDFGKSTEFFQNKLFDKEKSRYSHHGLISSIISYIYLKETFGFNAGLLGYITVKRHHGNLESPLNNIELYGDLKKQLENIKDEKRYKKIKNIYEKLLPKLNLNEIIDTFEEYLEDIDDFTDELGYELYEELEDEKSIERFLICNFIYSVLIDSDKKDASGIDNKYFSNNSKEKIDVKQYIKFLKEKEPNKFSDKIKINKLRTEFYDDVVFNKNLNKNNFLYSVSAPTGIGKTFTAFGLANKIKEFYPEGKRIIYSLPYTSIIDQNYNEIEKILEYFLKDNFKQKSKYLIKHHYLTPIKLEQSIENENRTEFSYNYNQQKLLIESWESANVMTTFIQVFHSIFSNKNSMLRKFHNIVNSVIILDEIQNLKYSYYEIVGKVFEVFSKVFKTYIIFLTATQPRIIKKEKLISLIDEKKYFLDEEFNRVKMKMINELDSLDINEFINGFQELFKSDTALIITNKIDIAIEIYKEMQNIYQDYEVYSLTTNLLPIDRLNLINEIKEKINKKEKIIVVSTQLVEAGVDFSFEEVYRDMSPIDSIVQSAGRSNRNNELKGKKGMVYLFNLTKNDKETSNIYFPQIINITKKLLKNSNELEGKEFYQFTLDYFDGLKFEVESDKILEAIKYLNYSENNKKEIPLKDFKLIEEDYMKESLIISPNDSIDEKIDVFFELIDNIKINNENLDNKIEKFENLKKELGNYIISAYQYKLDKLNDLIEEKYGYKYFYSKDYKIIYDKKIGFFVNEDNIPKSMSF